MVESGAELKEVVLATGWCGEARAYRSAQRLHSPHKRKRIGEVQPLGSERGRKVQQPGWQTNEEEGKLCPGSLCCACF